MKLLRAPFFLLLLSGLMAGLVFLGLQAPQALSETAPATVFSADRAMTNLRSLYPENLPHPAGSPQNLLLRDQLKAQLQKLGLQTEVQSLNHCRPAIGLCSPVHNVVGRLPGQDERSTLLLTAHYDSVEAGPGVGDDGAGVSALLEIANMVVQQGRFNHDLVFLFSDAEELGLLGADAFAQLHPWFAKVAVVINLDARGVSGPSTMFETGEGNRSYIRMLEQSLDRPVANSLSREVYRRMPNDTDFSIYRDLGRSGFNFAFTGGAAVYHSAIDDQRLLDAKSLQHHGQNTWALLKTLDQRDLQRIAKTEDAVYIDLFGHKLLHYPASSSTGLSLVLAVLILVLIRMAFPRQLSLRQAAWCGAFVLLLLPLMLGLGWLLSWPLGHWPDLNRMGHPYPWLGRIALFLTAGLSLRLLLNGLCQRATAGSVSLVCWLFFAALALLLSVKLPAASLLGILPMVAFMLGAVIDGFLWKRHTQLLFARLFGFIAAAYLGFYFYYSLEVVLSFEDAHWFMLPLVFPAIAALPLLAEQSYRRHASRDSASGSGHWVTALLLLPIVAACVGQQFIPGHTVERPRAMNLVYRATQGQPASWWQLETSSSAADRGYVQSQEFSQQSLVFSGNKAQEVLAKPATPINHPALSWQAAAAKNDGSLLTRSLQFDVPAGLQQLALFLPEQFDFTAIRVAGNLALQNDAAKAGANRPRAVYINRPAAGPFRVEISSPVSQAGRQNTLQLTARARFGLSEEALQSVTSGWPLDAQPQRLGHRAEIDYAIELD